MNEQERSEFDVNGLMRKIMFPVDYDRSDIEPFEVEVKLPPLMALFQDMYNMTMLNSGYQIKDSSPYLVKEDKWWLADIEEETTTVHIMYGDEEQQRGAKEFPHESMEEALSDLTDRVKKKFAEGYRMGKRRKITWEKIDDSSFDAIIEEEGER